MIILSNTHGPGGLSYESFGPFSEESTGPDIFDKYYHSSTPKFFLQISYMASLSTMKAQSECSNVV